MFARTPRLTLRPAWAEDAPALAAALDDPAVSGTLARVPHPYRLADAEAWIARPEERLPCALIFLHEGGACRLAGGVGLHDDEQGRPEIGYWVARDLWGRGIAREAGAALLAMADAALGLPWIGARHMVDNPRSGRVLAALGFRQTGRSAGIYSLARGTVLPALSLERHRPDLPRPALAA
ncbi:MAG: GNAT family N-acetyltransferase [Sphingomonas fennica]